MDGLLTSLRDHIFRDFFYIVAAGLIALSATELRPIITHPIEPEFAKFGLIIGVCYALGYINQELWSILPFIKTEMRYHFSAILRKIYALMRGRDFNDGNALPTTSMLITVEENPSYHRIVNLKQVCSAMGTALLTVSLLLFAKSLVNGVSLIDLRLALFSLMTLFIGIFMITMTWIHMMRQAEFVHERGSADQGVHARVRKDG